ncbi:MAG TPA: hypothetical protein VEY30_04550 [Myxococcaceae bacterium]|nr:hypothetical protein [Myxococcaceae bacterium]
MTPSQPDPSPASASETGSNPTQQELNAQSGPPDDARLAAEAPEGTADGAEAPEGERFIASSDSERDGQLPGAAGQEQLSDPSLDHGGQKSSVDLPWNGKGGVQRGTRTRYLKKT